MVCTAIRSLYMTEPILEPTYETRETLSSKNLSKPCISNGKMHETIPPQNKVQEYHLVREAKGQTISFTYTKGNSI